MRSQRHVQPQSLCKEEETWVFEQAAEQEGEEAVDEEVDEGKVESEPLKFFVLRSGRTGDDCVH